MIVERMPDVSNLSRAEKMLLMSELWEEVARDEMELPITREQIAELDRRMEHYRQHPEQVTSFEAIKANILAAKVKA